jgi:hypothetical protein
LTIRVGASWSLLHRQGGRGRYQDMRGCQRQPSLSRVIVLDIGHRMPHVLISEARELQRTYLLLDLGNAGHGEVLNHVGDQMFCPTGASQKVLSSEFCTCENFQLKDGQHAIRMRIEWLSIPDRATQGLYRLRTKLVRCSMVSERTVPTSLSGVLPSDARWPVTQHSDGSAQYELQHLRTGLCHAESLRLRLRATMSN